MISMPFSLSLFIAVGDTPWGGMPMKRELPMPVVVAIIVVVIIAIIGGGYLYLRSLDASPPPPKTRPTGPPPSDKTQTLAEPEV